MKVTIKELLQSAQEQLQHLDTARLDAEVLMAHVLNCGRETMFAHPRRQITEDQAADFQSLVSKRSDQYPVAYLLGKREFWSLDLLVNQYTLIPRPETETLIETALGFIQQEAELNILDLATGSGAISIAIARERPHCQITASDISQEALSVAKENALLHSVSKIRFHESDWFTGLKDQLFDLILCNPPYVDSHDNGFIEGEIRYEPRLALDGGHLGMQMINHIVPNAMQHLKQGGRLVMEHGYDQGESIRYLFVSNKFTEVKTRHDYAGLERISYAKTP